MFNCRIRVSRENISAPSLDSERFPWPKWLIKDTHKEQKEANKWHPQGNPSTTKRFVREQTNCVERAGTLPLMFQVSKKPDSIGQNNRIPDIQADKAGHRKLIEVETPQSLNSDVDQQATFRRSAGQKRNTTFDIEMTD